MKWISFFYLTKMRISHKICFSLTCYRYLAILWRNVRTPYLRLRLLMEMIARGVKSHLNEALRQTKKQLRYLFDKHKHF